MNINLIGRWRNEYGSILDIRSQNPTGLFTGVYTSDTGASGTYPMIGWSPDSAEGNQSLAFSVFWKPYEGDVDPSWHWTSVMSGCLFLDAPGEQPVIQVLHGMVASTNFPAVQVDRPGAYTESLQFVKQPAKGERASAAHFPRAGRSLKEASLRLVNVNAQSRYQSIDLTFDVDGSCVGVINTEGLVISGFADPDYPNAGQLQSLSFGALLSGGRVASLGFGGFIDYSVNQAALRLFEAGAVTYPNKYTSVSVSEEKFTVAIKHSRV